MKKYVALVMAIMLCLVMAIMLCLGVCACDNIDSSDAVNDSFATVNNSSYDNANSSPPTIYPLCYDSLNELKRSISRKNENKIYDQLKEDGIGNENIDKIKFFVKKMQSHNITVPYLSGKVIQFGNREGFPNISIYASEQYRLPWIFYYPEVPNGDNFYIKMAFIPDSIMEKQKNPTASEVIKELSPGSPNIDIIGDQHKSIYNQNIRLEDREVTALVIEYKKGNRNSTFFVYDDLLIEVRSDPEVWTEQCFAALSFGAYDVSNFNWVTIGVIIGIVPVAVWGVLYLSRRRKAKINESLV